ncbi:MAG: sugar phosphate isomerase/epimerase [Oscillospiraceae bacterium]
MKLGLLTVPFASQSLAQTLDYLVPLGVEAVELGTGGFTNPAHCDPATLSRNPSQAKALKALVEDHGMTISALSCHGNPVNPDAAAAARDHAIFLDTLRAAELLGVDTVVTFSGCPGGSKNATEPNWITCAWPPVYAEMLDYQWNDCLVPYWREAGRLAAEHGVKIAIEMHPGFCVYNTETMLRLREQAGEVVGANFDPSHLFWQGMDAVAAIRKLGNAIHYVHAKDCSVSARNVGEIGVLDTKSYQDIVHRAWVFRTVGYGHGEAVWRDLLSALRTTGYDGTISIEHEDALMSVNEGVEKALAFLRPLLMREPPCEMWWA